MLVIQTRHIVSIYRFKIFVDRIVTDMLAVIIRLSHFCVVVVLALWPTYDPFGMHPGKQV